MDRRRFLQGAGVTPFLWTPETLQAAETAKTSASAVARSTIQPALQTRLDSEISTYMKLNAAPGLQFALTDL